MFDLIGCVSVQTGKVHYFAKLFIIIGPYMFVFFSSSLCVQTGSVARQASCTMRTGGPYPGAKARPWRDADHSTLSNAEV
jgi:hypothetical protein